MAAELSAHTGLQGYNWSANAEGKEEIGKTAKVNLSSNIGGVSCVD